MGKSKNGQSLEVLKNLLGDDLFQTTLEVFAGQKLSFPKNPDSVDIDRRNRKIQSEYEQGVPIGWIAHRHNLTKSQIYRIIEKVS